MYGEKINKAIREFKLMMSRPIFESVEWMTNFELKKILAKAETQSGTASCGEMAEGRRIRLCKTPSRLPDGIPPVLVLSDGECRSTYSDGPARATEHIWHNTYTVNGKDRRDVEVSFFPKDVTFDELAEYYGLYYGWTKDKAAAVPEEVKRDIVKIFAGYVCPKSVFIRIFDGYVCGNAYGTVRQKVVDAKKREKEWKSRTLRGIDIDKKFAPITIPDDNNNTDMKRFEKEIDALFGGNVYAAFVPDEYEEIEGAQRDLDDWDVYRINLQNTIDEKSFWEQIYDRLYEDYGANQTVKASELTFWFDNAGSEIAEDALKKYEPDEDELIHRGVYKSDAYWHA